MNQAVPGVRLTELPRAALARLLRDAQADLHDYAALAALLERQFDCALRHDGGPLPALAERIGTLVDGLEQRRRTRVALVTPLQTPGGPVGMAALFASLPAERRAPVQALWTQLEQAVLDCKARNARNARLMTEQQALLQRVLHGTQDPLYVEPAHAAA